MISYYIITLVNKYCNFIWSFNPWCKTRSKQILNPDRDPTIYWKPNQDPTLLQKSDPGSPKHPDPQPWLYVLRSRHLLLAVSRPDNESTFFIYRILNDWSNYISTKHICMFFRKKKLKKNLPVGVPKLTSSPKKQC